VILYTSSENVHFNNNENSEVFNNNLLHLNNLSLNDNSTQNYNFNDNVVDIINSCFITKCVWKGNYILMKKVILSRLRTWTALNSHIPKYSLTLLHLLNHFFPHYLLTLEHF